jgi:hypothetical protein
MEVTKQARYATLFIVFVSDRRYLAIAQGCWRLVVLVRDSLFWRLMKRRRIETVGPPGEFTRDHDGFMVDDVIVRTASTGKQVHFRRIFLTPLLIAVEQVLLL